MAREHAKDTQERKDGGEDRSVARRESGQQPARSDVPGPISFMRRFMDDIDRAFDSLFVGPSAGLSRPMGNLQTTWMPPVEMLEQDGRIVVRVDVPGLNKDQIQVEFQDGQLAISGERRQEHEEKREGFYRSERVFGRFYRVIPLPDGVDPEQAKATFNNGVLEITVPTPPRPQAKRVEIQESAGNKQTQRAA